MTQYFEGHQNPNCPTSLDIVPGPNYVQLLVSTYFLSPVYSPPPSQTHLQLQNKEQVSGGGGVFWCKARLGLVEMVKGPRPTF